MNKSEKELFFELCKFCEPNKQKIEKLIDKGAASAELLGFLFANRVAGIAHGVLEKCDLLHKVDREFRTSIINATIVNKKITDDYRSCLKFVSTELSGTNASHAMLKGAYLCHKYENGLRTSNDIDILVSPNGVGKITSILRLAGFKQGEIKNGEFIPATRQQIIQSKMMRGETVPFIKPTRLDYVKYIEVDVNFSLDYKNGDDLILNKILLRTQEVDVGDAKIRTLDRFDFVLHLCSHLYKEATTFPWIKMKRDMTFYKYCDIYMLLWEFCNEDYAILAERAREIRLEKELIYCINSIETFFGMNFDFLREQLKDICETDEIYFPEEKKMYRYKEKDLIKRFFAKDRVKMLEEINV